MISKIKIGYHKLLSEVEFDCKKYNLVFGYNGSGKTTLSDFILENANEDTRVDLQKNGCKIHFNNEFDDKSNCSNIKVYSGLEYIQNNIKSSDKSAFFILGEESIKLEKEQELLACEKETLELKRNEYDKNIKSENVKLDELYQNISKGVRNILREIASQAFTKTHIKTKYDSLESLTAIQDEEYDNTVSKARNTDNKEHIEKLNMINIDFDVYSPKLYDLLKTKLQQPSNLTDLFENIIKCYHEDEDLQKWIQQGLRFTEFKEKKICPFCHSDLAVSNLFQNFIDYFEDKSKGVKDELLSIQNTIQSSKLDIGKIAAVRIQSTNFFNDEQKNVESLFEEIDKHHDDFEADYKLYYELINKKINLIYDSINDTLPDLSKHIKVINNSIEKINEIIQKHNDRVLNFKKEKDDASEAIKNHILYQHKDVVLNMREDIKKYIESRKYLSKKLIELEDKLKEIDSKMRDYNIPIKEFNENLKQFLGRDDISLHLEETERKTIRYKLIRKNGEEADGLSEGEKTVIGLLHFLLSIEHPQDKKNKSDCIVVIDDPISSLDSNSLYNAYAFLKSKLEGVEQIFILTHHFYFFKLVSRWFNPYNKRNEKDRNDEIKQIVRKGDKCKIEAISPFLKEYESEYHYTYDKLYKIHKKIKSGDTLSEDVYISLPNECRKLLESVVTFLRPFEGFNKGLANIIKESHKSDENRSEFINFISDFICRMGNTESHCNHFDSNREYYKSPKEHNDLLKHTLNFIKLCVPGHAESYQNKNK